LPVGRKWKTREEEKQERRSSPQLGMEILFKYLSISDLIREMEEKHAHC
jgi:hypothetical protein